MSTNPTFCSVCQTDCNSTRQLCHHEKGRSHLDKIMPQDISHITDEDENTKFTPRSFDDMVKAFSELGVSRESRESTMLNGSILHSAPKVEMKHEDPDRNENAMNILEDSSLEMNTLQPSGNKVNPLSKSHSPSPVPTRSNSIGGQESYVFDKISKTGKCFICNVELSSYRQKEDHISGKCHRHKMEQYEYRSRNSDQANTEMEGVVDCTAIHPHDTDIKYAMMGHGNERKGQSPDSKILMCIVCKVPFSSTLNMEQHFAGEKHRKQMMQQGLSQKTLYDFDPEETKKLTVFKSYNYDNDLLPSEKSIGTRNELQTKMHGHIPADTQEPAASAAFSVGNDKQSTSNWRTGNNDQVSNSNSLVCSVCEVSVTSSFNMEQHLAGENHKKQMMKRRYHQENHNVCIDEIKSREQTSWIKDKCENDISPNEAVILSMNQSEVKLESPLMSGNLKSRMEPENPNGNGQISTSGKHSLSNNLSTYISKETLSKDKQMIIADDTCVEPFPQSIANNNEQPVLIASPMQEDERDYIFDGIKGHCFACNVELTSLKLAQQHINGQTHRKKCQIRKQMKRYVMHDNKSGKIDDPSFGKKIISPQTQYHENYINGQDFYHFDGSKGFCRACNSDLSSPLQAKQHIEGKPHIRNVERLKMTKQGVLYPLYCDVCDKPFTGQESAVEHFTSEKHKLVEDLLNNESTQVLQSLDDALILSRKGQIWFFCQVCRKPMNTKLQLDIHKRSPNHLVELKNRSPKVRPFLSSDDSPPRCETLENHSMHGSETPTYNRTHSPQIGQEYRSSPDSQVALAQMKELLTFGENPVVTPDISSTKKKEYVDPQCQGMGQMLRNNSHSSSSGSGFLKQVEGNLQSSDNTDFGQGNMNQKGDTSSLINRGGQEYPGGSKISPDVYANAYGSPGAPTTSSMRKNDSNGNRPFGHGANCQGDNHGNRGDFDEKAEMNVSGGLNEFSSFGKVTTGYNGSNSRRSATERGQRNILSVDQADEKESSSDEEEDEDDTENMNIQGEETPLEHHRSNSAGTQPLHSISEAVGNSGKKNKYYCELCKKQMTSKKNFQQHKDGKVHQWTLSSTSAPSQSRVPIVKTFTPEEDSRMAFTMTKNIPRKYQVQLMEKAASSDCVVYLPTGTGKTMVSVLTIGLMLEKNPGRPIIFLVDKVLLVIQQARYIKTEFEGKKFKRASLQHGIDGEIVERELNLAFICRGLLCNNNLPIWQHDIIVTTADYCINMLNNGVILWEDFSLAVLDEVHHCVRKHPYRKLVERHHFKITDPGKRPKILGLTASPAGKSSEEATYDMLRCLLETLGDAKIAFVGGDGQNELESFQSNPDLHAVCVPLTPPEKQFQYHFINYFLRCYIKLAPLSTSLKNNNEPPCSYFMPVLQNPREEGLAKVTKDLINDSEPLSEILKFVFNAQCIANVGEEEKSTYDVLREHTLAILLHIGDIATGINFEELEKDFLRTSQNLEQSLGLPCETFYKQILSFKEEEGNIEPPMIEHLLQTLKDPGYIKWEKKDSMALVLVKERKNAKSLSKKLRHKPFIEKNDLRVTHLVGHGKGTQDGGMNVKAQKHVLDHQKKYDILVATSIAEEGIDIKNLELVVCMNPPSNVTALVQMRGRARKKGSHFVILCSNEEEMKKLADLLKQEENMLKAAKRCVETN